MVPEADLPLLRRIAASQRACAALGRELVHIPPFIVAIADDEGPGLSLAIPSEEAPPAWQLALASVAATLGRRGIRPVIEYLDELHPSLAAAAHGSGWRTASLAELLALRLEAPAAGRRGVAPSDAGQSGAAPSDAAGAGSLRYLRAEDTTSLVPYLRAQHRAYGGGGDELAYLRLMQHGLRTGSIAAIAFEQDGVPIAGASLLSGAGASELAGVWTLPEARRQGLARAVCRALLAHASAAGDGLVWLSAAPEVVGLYRSLGFETVGHQRNLTYHGAHSAGGMP